jgi:signal transduction histidine kinase/PAS domain-containing protein
MSPLEWERLVPAWLHNSSLQGILVVDTTLTVRFWNRWLVEASGQPAAQVIGQPLAALIPDLEEGGWEAAFSAALAGEERLLMQRASGYLITLPPSDGATDFAQMPQRVRISPLRDGAQIVGAVALIDDLTEYARHDQALERVFNEQQETLLLLEALLANAPIGFGFVDCDLRFRHVNERLAHLNQLPAERHIGHTYGELFPATAGLVMSLFQQVRHSGEPLLNHEVNALDPVTRTPLHFLVSYYPVRQSDGALIGLGTLVIETTDRKRTEAAIHLLEQFGALISAPLTSTETIQQVAQLIIPSLGECCLIEVFTNGQPEYFSASASEKEICQALVPLLQAAHSQPVLIGNVAQIAGIGAPGTTDLPLAKLSAQGIQAVFAMPLRARDRLIGAMACGSSRVYSADDFTLAAELSRRLAQVIDSLQLYQAEQDARASAEEAVQVRDEFFSIAAHELRTPLTTMLGRIQLLERRMRRAGAIEEHDLRAVQTINEQAQRLNRMISALLNVSQIDMGLLTLELLPLSLRDLTRRIVEEHRLALQRHTIAFIAPDDPVRIRGDELRLEQVLQNLLSNAAKYSPEGGQITVALTYDAGNARVAVSDPGIGIPAAELPRLFRRFYRAEHSAGKRVGGMGIGLYVVKEIVERHSGHVAVESTQGVGSTFTIELPLITAPANP